MSNSECAVRDTYLKPMDQRSRNMVGKSSLTWTIREFSNLNLKTGEECISPKFRINGMNKMFYLCVYPQGFIEDSKEYISVYLCSDSDDKVEIHSTLSVTNIDGSGEDYTKDYHDCNFWKFSGWYKFISKQELQSRKSQLFPMDELTFVCVITSPLKMSNFDLRSVELERHSTSVLRKELATFKISDFNKYNLKTGKSVNSKSFRINGMSQNFHLMIYPRGETEDDKDYMAVYLFSNSNDIMFVSFTISIVDIDNRNDVLRRNLVRICNFNSGWGWCRYISRKELESHLLQNGNLGLKCVINVTDHIVNKELTIDLLTNKEAISNDNNDLFIQARSILGDNKEYSDTVWMNKKENMPDSEIQLKTCPAVFAKMLNELENESDAEGYDNVLKELLKRVHHFDMVDFRLKLLSVAHKKNNPRLEDGNVKYLTDKMSHANIIDKKNEVDSLEHQNAKCVNFVSGETFCSRKKQKLD